ncbi:energy transducer TonB [Hymenobacter nivis]|uniref:TonB C-terminal domain-containing protein n=1 Tax=Hymenobacter nivis TaxID=1850093 RepID=A0A2Z3GY67_9BACT|nr:energy transducer TonB [Hymenobacter nivis]AWM33690.1 hypothetical protein DDQ68_13390 [Hymenobacter nivis]
MKNVLIGLLAAAWLLPRAPAHAQATAPGAALPLVGRSTGTTYRSPRFPGGPDSLQAALRRVLPPASPAFPGPLYLALELTGTGRPRNSYFLPAPVGAPALSRAGTQALLKRLEQLPAWQVAQDAPSQPGMRPDFIVLPLVLGAPAGAPALAYSDELPTFPLPAGAGQRPLAFNLLGLLQRQTRYPVDDIRRGNQGTVYAYFEVSETGAVEQRRIVGSVSRTLDAEVLRVLQLAPDALTPPRQQGRPVRVGYVLPFEFRVVSQVR